MDGSLTDHQRQFLIDLGSTILPTFKSDASKLIDIIIHNFDSWMAACFRERNILERPNERRIQIAMHKAGLKDRYPKYGGELTEQQRLEIQKFVKDLLGIDLFLAMGPVGITKNAELFGLPPRNHKTKLLIFFCPQCGQKYEAPENMAESVLDCHACGKQIKIQGPPKRQLKPRQFKSKEARLEAWTRKCLYEEEFRRGGDWSEFYHKPAKEQFDAVFSWLDANRPRWKSIKDVTDAIDSLFPELKKTAKTEGRRV